MYYQDGGLYVVRPSSTTDDPDFLQVFRSMRNHSILVLKDMNRQYYTLPTTVAEVRSCSTFTRGNET